MTKTKPPKAATRIITRGRNHSYELDGQKVDGVTTILGRGIPKPALVNWAARTVGEYVIDRLEVDRATDHILADTLIEDLRRFNETRKYPERLAAAGIPRVGLVKVMSNLPYAERDAAGNRGTEVHELAERLATGDEVTVPDELAGHVNSYLRFLEEWQPTGATLERVVINRRWRYMGRLDMIADLPLVSLRDGSTFGGRTLLDVKTSRSGPFGEVALQLAAYRFAESMLSPGGGEEPMEPVDSVAVVWVRADGYDLKPIVADEAAFRVFLHCKQVGDWLDEPGKDAVAEGLAPPPSDDDR